MSGEAVVLLHGIWMPAAEMLFIKRRFEAEHGMSCHLFDYRSVRVALDDNARELRRFVAALDQPTLHLVGHSLGGIVALRMLASTDGPRPGRVVCLGSPLGGSRAARQLERRRWGRAILGHSLPQGAIAEPASVWAADVIRRREVGVIAGSVSAGLGRLFASFDEQNDGSVAVAETRVPGLTDHIVMRVSHTGMLVSRAVADQAAAFVLRGAFLRDESGSDT